MLEVISLVKDYGRFRAVDDLSFTVPEGQIFGFVGPNGAGKTTTMKIMAGLLPATSGTVRINGQDVSDSPRALKGKIGYMPDFFGVYENLRVDEYMDFYAGAYHIPYAGRPELIANLLELVRLSDKREDYVDSLSRGMKQRLCLARSLVHDPELLILDEPASGLDPRARVEMKEILKQLKSMGKTIIISSHILSELAELSTVIGIIDKGRMVTHGSLYEMNARLQKRRIMVAKALGTQEALALMIQEQPQAGDIVRNADSLEFSFSGDDEALAALVKAIIQRDIALVAFYEKEGNLEDVFMQLTERGGEDD